MPLAELPALRTVDRALGVVDLIAAAGDGDVGLAEVAAGAGLSKATTLRMLGALQKRGYVVRSGAESRYSLGPRILSLAASLRPRLRALARPILGRLADATGETALIYLLDGTQRVCAEEVASRQPVRVAFEVGSRAPLHAGASGKVLLAYMSAAEREQFRSALSLERYTGATIQTWTELERELGEIRSRGYAVSEGEHDAGVFGISAPVFGPRARLDAALSVVGPISRWSAALAEPYGQYVKDGARELSRALGHVELGPAQGPRDAQSQGEEVMTRTAAARVR